MTNTKEKGLEAHLQETAKLFDEKFPNASCFCSCMEGDMYDAFPETIKEVKEFIESSLKSAYTQGRKDTIEEVVDDYTNWLIKHCYVDSDVYTEEPKAADAYLSEVHGIK